MPVEWSVWSGWAGWRRTAPLLMAGAVALLGCREATVCPADLRVRVTPADRTVAVGESFTATAEAFGCGGTERLPETWVWTTVDVDVDVVEVDSLTGRITGRMPGTAFVGVRGRTYGPSGAGVRVTVQ